VDRGNYIAGVVVVAAPVLNSKGNMSYGLAGVGLLNQLDSSAVNSLAADLFKAAQELSSRLVSLR
jgi:DNA-binding IclR family transcriptional regulator